ncbi:sulfatase family protein [Paenibacillus agaridevorans]|uniref:sulfatase family protein n=1 Tax=Paenibacillus agaridevorans TaxID=171404 RepID=UPI001BE425DB|nr:sulfatase-like hydrolase/transferase [Paenibacillus agaridevorans]
MIPLTTNTRPHVFFLMCDELRADSLGFMGNSVVQTPHLDELAQDSVIFENAYTNCPMCVPARASMMTGRNPLSNGVLDNAMRMVEDEKPLPDLLRKNGYTTTMYGKLHVHRTPEECGFDEFKFGYPDPYTSFLGIQDPEVRKNATFKKNEGDIPLVIHGESPTHPDQTSCSRLTADYIQRMDRIQTDEKPIFHYLSLLDPHTPYMPTKPYSEIYNPEELPLPQNAGRTLADKPITQRYFHKVRGFDKLNEEDYRKSLASYYGLVTHVDDRIGKVIDRLKELELYDDALIIFTSDHGSMMGEHGFIEKWGHMYEPVVRIPLLVKLPKNYNSGLRLDTFAEIIDLLPTVLDAAGIEIPEEVQGMSLMPVCRGERTVHRTEAHSQYFCGSIHVEPALMIRDHDFKLTVYPEQESIHEKLYGDHYLKYSAFFDQPLVEGELYDLRNDPYEERNLFGDPDYAQQQARLQFKLAHWKEGLGPLADYRGLRQANMKTLYKFILDQANNWTKVSDALKADQGLTQCDRQKTQESVKS